jgi:hypothetical protein
MLEQMAVQKGMSAAQIMLMGDNAGTKAAYNAAYQVAAQRSAIQEAKHTAALNISAVKQDKVLSDASIQLNQDQAAAMALVQAAAAGVEGGSVEDTIYETERTEAMALAANRKKAEQQEEQYLATIGSQTSALLTIEDPEYSSLGSMFNLGAEMFNATQEYDDGQLENLWQESKGNFAAVGNSISNWFGSGS